VEINPQIVDNQTAGGDALIFSTLVIQYDLVLANNLQSWRVIHAARAFQKPSIWWLHQSYSAELLMYGQKNVALAFSTADTVIFPVEAMTMLYTPLSRRDNYVVIPYGFDLEIDSNYTLNMNRAKLTIVQVVTGDSAESPDLLIKAIANLPQAIRRDISCYFINTPKSVDYKNFHFVDELLPEQVAHYIQSADVLVSSAKEGTLSWVILQAMGLGKAVIATNFDSTAEVIEHQVTGLLVSPDDDQALTICLMRLFHDPEYRRQLGGAARRKFEQELSMDLFGQKIIRIIESVNIG
jgi:glycosyltransferase involved in cell wall biosynthesis